MSEPITEEQLNEYVRPYLNRSDAAAVTIVRLEKEIRMLRRDIELLTSTKDQYRAENVRLNTIVDKPRSRREGEG